VQDLFFSSFFAIILSMDDQGLRKMVEETMELSKDNNRILHSIQRRERMTQIMRVVYWLFILGITAGAYYYVQPYIDQLVKAYTGLVDTQHKVADISGKLSLDSIKNYFK
jgi:magnesium-transporting ATPase (P-type)